MTTRIFLLFTTAATLTLSGCAGAPDIAAWRAETRQPREETQRGDLTLELAEVDVLRDQFEWKAARDLALTLVTEVPDHAEVLWRAARAESDRVICGPDSDDDAKKLAALSALDYAERAVATTPDDANALGQLSWALGASTHLQPMFDRSDHAHRTLDVIESALEADPNELSALATLATLRLRLATLPWIAKVMASSAPDGDLEEARTLAQRCIELSPTLEHRLLLAKVERARDEERVARSLLEHALASEPRGTRDIALRDAAQALLEELGDD